MTTGLAKVPKDRSPPLGQQLAEFSFAAADAVFRAGAVYARTPGLSVHPSKGFQGQPAGVMLGAGVDGVAGTVGPQSVRRLALARTTILMAKAGSCRGRSRRQLVGGWTFAACFQRHSLSVFREVYRALGDPKLDQP